jgi:hypothetical protein
LPEDDWQLSMVREWARTKDIKKMGLLLKALLEEKPAVSAERS